MYLFVDLTVAGIALAIRQPYVLVILLILVPLQIMNSRKESGVLHDKFGARYKEYRRGTWF
jgi:protein-S-isoprenylcysteine O-methyltransferase Ste14